MCSLRRGTLIVSLVSMVALKGVQAQGIKTVGDCSPVIVGVGSAAKIEIKCDGVTRADLDDILGRINTLTAMTEEGRALIAGVIEKNATQSADKMRGLLREAAQQLYETKRLQYRLDYEEIPVTATVRYSILENALMSYGTRIQLAVKERQRQTNGYVLPNLFPFSGIEWIPTSSDYFPKKSDGLAYEFLMSTEVTLHCYSRAQRSDSTLGPKIEAATKISDANAISSGAFFSQKIRLQPGKCGTGFVVGEAFGEKAVIIRGERIIPEGGSVVRPGSFISALDLFGGGCFLELRNSLFPSIDAADLSTQKGVFWGMAIHLTKNLEYSTDQNNFKRLDSGPGYQLFRWTMPQQVSDLSRLFTVGKFPPTPRCNDH